MKNLSFSFAFVLVVLLSFHSRAQQLPVLQWSKHYGGSSIDVANAVHHLPDGSIVFSGYTSSDDNQVSGNHGGYDVWLVKLNASGKLLWQKCYGGAGLDQALGMQVLPNGNMVLAGVTATTNNGDVLGNHGSNDAWVMVMDNNGNLLHQRCFGGSGIDGANAVALTKDGYFLIAGYTRSTDGDVSHPVLGIQDAWLLKLDTSLNKVWDLTAGGTLSDYSSDVIQKANGDYAYFTSEENCEGDCRYANAHIVSPDGNPLQIIGFNSYHNYRETSHLLQKTNGNFIGGGIYNDFIQTDLMAFESMENGIPVWTQVYEDEDEIEDQHGGNVGIMSDGTVLLSGYNGPELRATLSMLDAAGNITATGLFGGSSASDAFNRIETDTTLKVIYISGNSMSSDGDLNGNYGNADAWILKFNEVSANGCAPPSNLQSSNITSTSAKLSWAEATGATGYKVRYKVNGTSAWIKLSSIDNDKIINGLQPNTTYSWQTKTVCGLQPVEQSSWSAKQEFFTATKLAADKIMTASFEVFPNPVSDGASITFCLPEVSEVNIELFDLQGRKIKTIAEGNFAKGNHQLLFQKENLTDGVYMLQLKSNTALVEKKILIQ